VDSPLNLIHMAGVKPDPLSLTLSLVTFPSTECRRMGVTLAVKLLLNAESVSGVLLGLGRLNFKHLVVLRKVKFYWHLYCSTDVFLRDMFLNFLLCYFKYDSVLKSVFYSRSDAVSNVYIFLRIM